jgi:cellulose 1,4-beta-cellobiosidase
MTPSNGVTWQYRSSAGGGTSWNNTGGLSAPYWVKLARTNNTFTGYCSPDGTNWTQQGTMTNAMSSNVYVGLALTSHNSSTLCTATFDNVTVPGWPTSPPPAAPTGLTATSGDAQVGLSWNSSSGATSYHVKCSTTSGGDYTTVATTASLAFTNTGLVNGTTRFYVVSALDTFGESTNSAEVSAHPISSSPVAINVTYGSGQLQFSWPADHAGWLLQSQTNSLAVGLSTNWVNVASSDQTNQMTLLLKAADGTVFFRLARP